MLRFADRVGALQVYSNKTTGGHPKDARQRARRSVEDEIEEESLTHEGVIPGTTAYMSPEQVKGEELDGPP